MYMPYRCITPYPCIAPATTEGRMALPTGVASCLRRASGRIFTFVNEWGYDIYAPREYGGAPAYAI